MGAPKPDHRKISFNCPIVLLEKLEEYPGDQTWKIIQLLEYGLASGFFMTLEQAKELCRERAEKMLQMSERNPTTKLPKRHNL